MHTLIVTQTSIEKREARRTARFTLSPPSQLAWSRITPVERLAEAYEMIHCRGGKVFTLRLDLDALIAVTGSGDPARTMSRRIQRAFKRACLPSPAFAFFLEVTPDKREQLHVHGAIVLGGMQLAAVKDALREAAGRIVGHSGSRQVQLKKFDFERGGTLGWARYPKKGASRTKRVIQNEKLTYISLGLRRLAQFSWDGRPSQTMH